MQHRSWLWFVMLAPALVVEPAVGNAQLSRLVLNSPSQTYCTPIFGDCSTGDCSRYDAGVGTTECRIERLASGNTIAACLLAGVADELLCCQKPSDCPLSDTGPEASAADCIGLKDDALQVITGVCSYPEAFPVLCPTEVGDERYTTEDQVRQCMLHRDGTVVADWRLGDCDADGRANGNDCDPCDSTDDRSRVDTECPVLTVDDGLLDGDLADAGENLDAGEDGDGGTRRKPGTKTVRKADPNKVTFTGGGGCAAGNGATGGSWAAWLAALLAVLVAARRRRRL